MGLAADFRFMRSLAASSSPCAAARSTRSTSSHPQHLVCKSAASVVVAKRSPFLLQCVRPLAVLGRLFFSVPAFPWVRFVSLLSLLAVHSCGWACPRLCRVLGSLGVFGCGHLALVVDGASGCVVWAVRCPCGRMAGGVADATGLRLGLCF